MGNEFVRSLLSEQRNRLVASLLGYIDRNINPKLTVEEQQALRDKVRTSVSSYHDTTLDCLKASVNDGSMHNDYALALLSKINEQVRVLANGQHS